MPLILLPEIGELGVRLVHSLDVAGLPGVGRKLSQFTCSRLYRPARVPGRFPMAVTVVLLPVRHAVTCLMACRHPGSGNLAFFDSSRYAQVERNINPVIVRLVWHQEYSIGLSQFEPELAGAC